MRTFVAACCFSLSVTAIAVVVLAPLMDSRGLVFCGVDTVVYKLLVFFKVPALVLVLILCPLPPLLYCEAVGDALTTGDDMVEEILDRRFTCGL